MSSDLQVVLWVIGILTAVAVPAGCWIINSIISLRTQINDQKHKTMHLATVIRILARNIQEEQDKKLIESHLDATDM